MRVLVTGGAGFIGSHLVDSFLESGDDVTILDDLSTGVKENLAVNARFVEGDVAELDCVRQAMAGAEVVLHQAASRAVQRSVDNPIETDRTNTLGTLNVLVAARDEGVRRVVIASSSSVYGGAGSGGAFQPRSPYAVSKLAAEHYARVFTEVYDLEAVCLRYFNVFGPRQRPDSAYAAVIPLFVDALAHGRRPEIHGDGHQSRDFTWIEDVVRANRLALSAPAEVVAGRAYDIGAGREVSVLEVLTMLAAILEVDANPVHLPARPGDVRSSRAETEAAARELGFTVDSEVETGLKRTVRWLLAASA